MASTMALQPKSSTDDLDNGRCAMRGSCGGVSAFDPSLPCPYDGPPEDPADARAREFLVDVCGPAFSEGPVCCVSDQVETLRSNLDRAEAIISTCPACRNNFRHFFCSFTCSPHQASFLNITSTQKTSTGKQGVKSIDFHVSEEFGEGFFNSCKDVQFGGANLFVMDLIGGGATNYHDFFKFMGKVDPVTGSPFQINFPSSAPPDKSPFYSPPRNCADNDLSSRCTCVDCPDVCPTLPDVYAPGAAPTCHVGAMSCLTFILVLGYTLAVVSFFIGFFLQKTIRKRRDRAYSELHMSSSSTSMLNTPLSPRVQTRGLVGASSLAQTHDREDSLATPSESRHLGRGASLLDPIETVQPRQYPINTMLRRFFYRLGLTTATYPWLTFAIVFAVVGLLNLGWKRFEIETDPVHLWVAPNSETKLQKEYFDEHFGPFYRPQQIFATSTHTRNDLQSSPSSSASLSANEKEPVLSWENLKWWMDVETKIRKLRSPSGYTLSDVCFKPLGPGTACVVQSVGGWFGNDLSDYDPDTWADHLAGCAAAPVECPTDFRLPLQPQYVLGGVPRKADGSKDVLGAKALVSTYVLANSLNQTEVDKAEEWERTLRQFLEDLAVEAPEAGLQIAFSTGVSLTEEINKSTNTDVRIVVLSYVAMFFYVAFTLGSGSATRDDEGLRSSLKRWAVNFPKLFRRSSLSSSSISVDSSQTPTFFPRLPRKLFVGSKFTLGLFGIVLVILSVSSSVGLFSATGVKVTLIIAEVIPFLVLAVGVDNVFILVHELDRQNFLHGPNAAVTADATSPGALSPPANGLNGRSAMPETSGDDSIEAQPMPTYFAAEERVARALAKMGPSILLSTIAETTAFALGALVPMPAVRNFALYAAGSVLLNAVLQCTVFVSAMALDLRRVEASRVDCFPCVTLPSRIALLDAPPSRSGLGTIAKFIRRRYAPFLLRPVVKSCVIAAFGGLFVASAISIQHIELGFDQRLALPSDSYLIDWFDHLDAYFEIGPPVYFVSHDADVTTRDGQRKLCGRFSTCDELSMASVLEGERHRPESSFISQPAGSWIDDFMWWLNPNNDGCCRVFKRDPDTFCGERDRPRSCKACLEGQEPGWNITMAGLPEGEDFMRYLKQWLASPTNDDCPLAGGATYGQALALSPDEDTVVASHFRTYHAPLRSQADFINSLAAARRIADDIGRRTGTKVFPYSLHYVFFDQYATIIATTQELLGLGLAAVLLVTAVLLGSWRTGTIVTAVVALTVTSCMGVMGIWGISLNAISLVNLVISLGIAVEFCAHVARAFMSAGSGLPVDHPAGQKERDERMWTALVDVGPSVLSGVTFTKLIGMSVLALTRSRLLEVYYFRMWLTLIISGALHGLVLLPVVLSLAGGPGFPYQEADEEWMSNAIRDDYEYAPFLADDESVGSN